MKKAILTSMILALGIPFASGCSTDTHYDSVSTSLHLKVTDIPKDGSTMKIRQRFHFDRDLAPLTSMNLAEAWISAPSSDDEWLDTENVWSGGEFTLDIVQSVSVSLVDGEDASQSTMWLYVPSYELHDEHAIFTEYIMDDLRTYLNNSQQLELEVEIAMEPYYVMHYWRDVCGMSEDCTITLPFSMQFKMVD